MPGIDCSQERDGLTASQFAQDNSIRAKPKRSNKEVIGAHVGFSKSAPHRNQANGVVMPELQLRRVFDENESFFGRNFLQQCVQKHSGALATGLYATFIPPPKFPVEP